MKPKILLIAPPHNNIAEPFRAALEKNGFAVTVVESSSKQSRLPRTEQFALVVDLQQNGQHEIGDAAIGSYLIEATFLSPNRAFPGTIQLLQNGVYRLGADEADVNKFVDTVRELLKRNANCHRDQSQRSEDPDPAGQPATSRSAAKIPTWRDNQQPATSIQQPDFIGQSPRIEDVRQLIKCFSQFDGMTFLITGETGTGKEVVAHLLHASSMRAGKPFIPVNCGAIPDALFESEFFGHCKGAFTGAHAARKGLVEAAQDGTLFLDEISTMTLSQQVKLLRLLENHTYRRVGETEERPSNAWIIAASNENLEDLIEQKRFRSDLYYRLKVNEINLPPLRERGHDILLFAEYFLAHFAQKFGTPPKSLSAEAQEALLKYHWPGNVRELKHVIHGVSINCPEQQIMTKHLPSKMQKSDYLRQEENTKSHALEDLGKMHILEVLKQCHFNISQAAVRLGIHRKTLHRKLAKYQINVEAFRLNGERK